MTGKGILNKGKPFALNTVYRILQNEKYTGKYCFKEEVSENMYPQIIPEELYEKVRAISEKNKRGKRSIKTVYLLRDKMICGYCGMPVVAESNTGKKREPDRFYYKCKGRKRKLNDCRKADG